MPCDWDAAAYSRLSTPQTAMGRDVLARLELAGDETVLDAGCGSGNVTELLVDRLPAGRVIAVDGSPSMVREARERLPDRVDVREADLLELELEEPVDAILSTATFHWILDHDRLFALLHAALKPGGRLVAQRGGEGNVAAGSFIVRLPEELRDDFVAAVLDELPEPPGDRLRPAEHPRPQAGVAA